MKSFIYGTLAVVSLFVCFSFGEVVKPAIIQSPGQWTVESRYTQPQQIIISGYPDGKARRFWYMIFTLTNNTGKDVDFYPQCELMTDTFQIIHSGDKMPSVVFEQIKRRHRGSYPFLELLQNTNNRLLQGEDNTKDLAIIWPDFDPKAKNINIFIGGLSNEVAVINDPIEKDENGRPARVFLRKTLQLNYDITGDPAFRSKTNLQFQSQNWIMR